MLLSLVFTITKEIICMTTRERYADIDLRRVMETPRDALEREYSDQEATAEAQRVWEKLARSPRHRERVIKLLAREVLETMPRQEIELSTDLINE
jgi:hypothetical protein